MPILLISGSVTKTGCTVRSKWEKKTRENTIPRSTSGIPFFFVFLSALRPSTSCSSARPSSPSINRFTVTSFLSNSFTNQWTGVCDYSHFIPHARKFECRVVTYYGTLISKSMCHFHSSPSLHIFHHPHLRPAVICSNILVIYKFTYNLIHLLLRVPECVITLTAFLTHAN